MHLFGTKYREKESSRHAAYTDDDSKKESEGHGAHDLDLENLCQNDESKTSLT